MECIPLSLDCLDIPKQTGFIWKQQRIAAKEMWRLTFHKLYLHMLHQTIKSSSLPEWVDPIHPDMLESISFSSIWATTISSFWEKARGSIKFVCFVWIPCKSKYHNLPHCTTFTHPCQSPCFCPPFAMSLLYNLAHTFDWNKVTRHHWVDSSIVNILPWQFTSLRITI